MCQRLKGRSSGGLAIGRVEGAILGGMLIGAHVHVEGGFDVGDGALDLDSPCHRGSRRRPGSRRSWRSGGRRRSLIWVGPKRAVNSAGVRNWR